jgi:hypothetical protein
MHTKKSCCIFACCVYFIFAARLAPSQMIQHVARIFPIVVEICAGLSVIFAADAVILVAKTVAKTQMLN